jgi:uncharacterized protein (DUF1919 family)
MNKDITLHEYPLQNYGDHHLNFYHLRIILRAQPIVGEAKTEYEKGKRDIHLRNDYIGEQQRHGVSFLVIQMR